MKTLSARPERCCESVCLNLFLPMERIHSFFCFIPYFSFRRLRFVSAFIWTGSGGKPLPVQIKAPRSRAARRRKASSGGSGARGGEEKKKREARVNGTFLAIVQEEKSAATGRRKKGRPGSHSAAGPPLFSERGRGPVYAVTILLAFCRPSCSTAFSRILYLRILPAAFIGNASTNEM